MKIVVTRHPALLAYLYEIGLINETESVTVMEHVGVEDEPLIRGRDIIGTLPNHLACQVNSLTEVPLFVPDYLRGKELAVTAIREFAGTPRTYIITKRD